jgi:hypothetical protein
MPHREKEMGGRRVTVANQPAKRKFFLKNRPRLILINPTPSSQKSMGLNLKKYFG